MNLNEKRKQELLRLTNDIRHHQKACFLSFSLIANIRLLFRPTTTLSLGNLLIMVPFATAACLFFFYSWSVFVKNGKELRGNLLDTNFTFIVIIHTHTRIYNKQEIFFERMYVWFYSIIKYKQNLGNLGNLVVTVIVSCTHLWIYYNPGGAGCCSPKNLYKHFLVQIF